ncbi:MAG: MG2 domain-containing protein, partial [Myxococcaceae bacterium]
MRAGSTRLVCAAVLAAAALTACKGKPSGSDQTLQPLPAPPALDIAREALPAGGLTVVAARPHEVVGADARPTITFSRPVVALMSIEEQKALAPPASLSPAVDGEWRWIGSASVEFVPKIPLPFATRFTVTVPSGLKGVDGSTLKEGYSWSFDTPGPRLESAAPAGGSRWLRPSQDIVLVFNQAVVEPEKAISLRVGPEGTTWPVTVSAKPAGPAPESVERPGRDLIASRRTAVTVKIDRPLPLATAVELVIAPSLRAKEGPLTLEQEVRLGYHTYGPARIEGVQACLGGYACPYGPLVIESTNPLDVASLKAHLKVQPAVQIDWDRAESQEPYGNRHNPYTTVPGSFRPGTTYVFTIASGVKDVFGQTAPAAQGQARTDDLKPEYELGPDVALLEAKGDGDLPVRFTNVTELDAQLWPLGPAEMARFLGGRRNAQTVPAGQPINSQIALDGTHNLPGTRPVKVRELLAGKGTGLFHLVTTAPEIDPHRGWQRTQHVTGQITDLAVHTKLGATSGIVWVTRVSDGTVVPGAALSLYDGDGAVKWQGKTDADGLARVPGLSSLLGPRKGPRRQRDLDGGPGFAMIAASLAGDTGVTLADWSGGFSPWAFGIEGAWDGKRPQSMGFATSERGIYRPGDTVDIKGMLRYRRLGVITTPVNGTRADVSVTDARGKEIWSRSIPLSDFGTFSAEVPIDAAAPLGTYSVRVVAEVTSDRISTGTSFRVEEYRPPQFKVDVTTASSEALSGQKLQGRVLARYLFGGAMPGATVRWTATRATDDYQPPDNPGFAFGINTWEWSDDRPGSTTEVIGAGEGKTDAQGVFEIDAGQVETPGGRSSVVTLEAEVADVNRQRIANRAVVHVHPAALYAGVRQRNVEGFAEVGKPVSLEAVAVSPDGKRQKGEVQISVFRRDWKFVRKKTGGDRWETLSEPVEEPVASCTVKVEQVPGACSFTPKAPGLHVVQAEVVDAQKRKQTTRSALYVVGDGWVSWQRNDSDRIDLVTDKAVYDVGETARVLVKSPFPSAEAVLTVEREGVSLARHVKLKGAATTLEVPVGETGIPDVYVGVVLVRGRVPQANGPEAGEDPG